jgi:aquaporin Z
MAKKPAKKAAASRTTATKAKVTRKTAASGASVWQDVVKQFKGFALSPAALIAEFLGTFLLALVIVNYAGSQLVAMIALIVLVLVFAQFSGPHFNPAFTIGAWLNRQITGARTFAYVTAQTLGAVLAWVVAKAYVPQEVNPFTGEATAGTLFTHQALPEETGALWSLLGAEALGMAVFALGFSFVLFTKASTLAKAITLGGALFLGLVLLREAVVLNPAVALTVGALAWDAWSVAIYLLVPVLVTALVIAVYRLMQKDVKV